MPPKNVLTGPTRGLRITGQEVPGGISSDTPASIFDIRLKSAPCKGWVPIFNRAGSPPRPAKCNLQGRTKLVYDVWDANARSGGGSGAIVVPVTNEGGTDATETVAVKPATGTIQA